MASVSIPAPDRLVGQNLGENRYKILAQLGRGSMGYAYRAFDRKLEIEVVIKVPKAAYLADDDFRRRFEQETALLIRLRHPHIVTVIDVGDHEGIPFLVMDYLSGGSLQDCISAGDGKQKAMPVEFLKDWLPHVASALDFVHKRGIIHRDVKPENILFDDDGNAFLSDFGLTKMLHAEADGFEATETIAGGVVGTPNYVAPELVLGLEYDGRVDQYSLAMTVYEVLTGSPPFATKSGSATMVRQTREKAPQLNTLREDIPATVARGVERAISKKPARRFESCGQFVEVVVSSISQSRRQASGQKRPKESLDSARRQRQSNADSSAHRDVVESTGSGGRVPCPSCQDVLPLKPEHAGRRGRCIKCHARLAISQDLTTLRLIPERGTRGSRSPSGSSSTGSAKSSSDELVIGQEVFGRQISHRTAIVIAVALLGAMIAAAVFVTNTWNSDHSNSAADQHRSMEED